MTELCVRTLNKLHTNHWRLAVELCWKSLKESDVLKVHAHIWLSLKGQRFALQSLAYKGTVPYENYAVMIHISRSSSRAVSAAMAGAFYCSIEKIGSVGRWGNIEPWTDYGVKDTWITSLYVAKKISSDVAKRAYILTVTRAQ